MSDDTKKPITDQAVVKAMAVEALRQLDVLGACGTKMSLTCRSVLLAVAQHPGITTKQLSKHCEIDQSSVSRNLASLGTTHRDGTPGFGFVEVVPDPKECRRLIARLTPRGEQFVAAFLYPGVESPVKAKPRRKKAAKKAA